MVNSLKYTKRLVSFMVFDLDGTAKELSLEEDASMAQIQREMEDISQSMEASSVYNINEEPNTSKAPMQKQQSVIPQMPNFNQNFAR